MCNKVRHVIEEEVCYLIYLRGRQSFFFREGVVFYKQGTFR